MFRRLLQGVQTHLPSRCAVCHAWPAQALCAPCIATFAQAQTRCATCARVLPGGAQQCGACLREPPVLDACLAALRYAYPWSELVAQFKFRQQCGWAPALARLLRSAPGAEAALCRATLLLPMPLSAERLRARGFNQALALAQALDAAKVAPTLLLRVRDTPSQRTCTRAERLRNVRHALAVAPQQAERLRGQRVLLLDDVMTSGAAHITALVLARAEWAP